MSYDELLRHPKWQKRRLEIMNRDHWKCQCCGEDDKTLNVHHKFYAKDNKPWEYPDIDLITLCDDCHGKHHKVTDVFKNYTLAEKFDFFRRGVGDTPGEKRELDEFFIVDHLKNPNHCFIVHVPTGLFSTFCCPVKEAYDKMKSKPEILPKIKKIIIDKMTTRHVFE